MAYKYFFYKIYKFFKLFQDKIDAVYFSLIILSFISGIIFLGLLSVINLIIKKNVYEYFDEILNNNLDPIIAIISVVMHYFLFIYKKKYLLIIDNEHFSEKDNNKSFLIYCILYLSIFVLSIYLSIFK